MAIPKIKHYEPPLGVPLSRASLPWTVDPDRAALLIHDMQNYFLDRYESERFVSRLVGNISQVRRSCHAQGIPTFYTAQPGNQPRSQRGLLVDFWGQGIPDDEHALAIVQGLEPVPGKDEVLVKHRYSAFAKSIFLRRLQELGRTQLIVCGVYAHIGCLVTATETFMADIQPFVVADALGDFSLVHHLMALEHMGHCSSKVVSTAEVLSQLAPRLEMQA